MSRLKYTRRRVDIIKISSATKYLTLSKSFVPETFNYFFELEIFLPHKRVTVDEFADIFYVSPGTAVKMIKKIQVAYNRPAHNFVTVKDLCKFYKIDESHIQKYFFHEEAIAFFKRADRLKSK
jgi:hypothetical protein